VALLVSWTGDNVTTFSVSGAVTVSARKFGPYDVPVDRVPTGGSIGLVFDSSDAGDGMACVSSVEGDGRVRDSDCATFAIVPTVITHASVHLE
jgi:hypothetical protein